MNVMCLISDGHLFFNPAHNQINGIFLLFVRQFSAGRNTVPFFETTPAAGCGGVLSDKNRMIFHRCLMPVVFNDGGSQPCGDKIFGMPGK